MSLSIEAETCLKNKIRELERENTRLREKLNRFENKESVCYGCGEVIDGPGHGDCERNW